MPCHAITMQCHAMPCRRRATQAVGTLRPDVAAELGLPPEVIVAPGGGDNAMAALGSGAVREGTWVLSLGTSGGWHDRVENAVE